MLSLKPVRLVIDLVDLPLSFIDLFGVPILSVFMYKCAYTLGGPKKSFLEWSQLQGFVGVALRFKVVPETHKKSVVKD